LKNEEEIDNLFIPDNQPLFEYVKVVLTKGTNAQKDTLISSFFKFLRDCQDEVLPFLPKILV
jgi:hypothetical protein